MSLRTCCSEAAGIRTYAIDSWSTSTLSVDSVATLSSPDGRSAIVQSRSPTNQSIGIRTAAVHLFDTFNATESSETINCRAFAFVFVHFSASKHRFQRNRPDRAFSLLTKFRRSSLKTGGADFTKQNLSTLAKIYSKEQSYFLTHSRVVSLSRLSFFQYLLLFPFGQALLPDKTKFRKIAQIDLYLASFVNFPQLF